MAYLLGRGLQRDVVYLGGPIAPSYMSPNAGDCGFSANEYSCAVHRSPNKLWRSNSIFNPMSPGLEQPLSRQELELQLLVPGDAVLLDVGDAQLGLQAADLGRLPPHQLPGRDKARAARLAPLPADSAHILYSNLNNKKKWRNSFRKPGGRQCFRSVINLIRIRIQHFRLNTGYNPDPGFWWPKNYKFTAEKKIWIKNYNLPIPRPP